MPVKKKTRRTQSLGVRFKKSPVTTTVNEAKKLGIPKVVTKAAIVGITAAIITPQAATALDRIPFMNIFTGYGRAIRSRLEGMR
jgi:hypothetical protein